MTGALEITILGCGSSGGVPRADGDWGVCDPAEPKNRRLRCSLLVRRKAQDGEGPETTVLVDTSPDLREQAIAARVKRWVASQEMSGMKSITGGCAGACASLMATS